MSKIPESVKQNSNCDKYDSLWIVLIQLTLSIEYLRCAGQCIGKLLILVNYGSYIF